MVSVLSWGEEKEKASFRGQRGGGDGGEQGASMGRQIIRVTVRGLCRLLLPQKSPFDDHGGLGLAPSGLAGSPLTSHARTGNGEWSLLLWKGRVASATSWSLGGCPFSPHSVLPQGLCTYFFLLSGVSFPYLPPVWLLILLHLAKMSLS